MATENQVGVDEIPTPWNELRMLLDAMATDDPELARAVRRVNGVMRAAHLTAVMRFGRDVEPELVVQWADVFSRAVSEELAEGGAD